MARGNEYYMTLNRRGYTRKPVSPLIGSGPPCCGGGLCGLCLLIIHFKF